MRLRTMGLIWTIAFMVVSFASAADVRTDDELRQAVEGKLSHEDVQNGSGPWATAENGVVTLTGTVKSVWARDKALELAMEVEDVTAVVDELEIAEAESDDELFEEIAKTVNRYAFFTVYDDVNVAVEAGHVRLEGRVTMPFKSDELEKRIAKVMGVQGLTNEIRTLPTNIGDQRLRSRLVYRIYGDPLFRDYAFRANPPVHIIVENGRVALTGAVRSNVEKRKAEHIARQTFGVFAVENRLSVGD